MRRTGAVPQPRWRQIGSVAIDGRGALIRLAPSGSALSALQLRAAAAATALTVRRLRARAILPRAKVCRVLTTKEWGGGRGRETGEWESQKRADSGPTLERD